MSARLSLSTAWRILLQLRHDHRTVSLLIAVPSMLMILLRYVINNPAGFDRYGPMLLGVFPFVVMFVITSVATPPARSRCAAALRDQQARWLRTFGPNHRGGAVVG